MSRITKNPFITLNHVSREKKLSHFTIHKEKRISRISFTTLLYDLHRTVAKVLLFLN